MLLGKKMNIKIYVFFVVLFLFQGLNVIIGSNNLYLNRAETGW
ncbi:hypothetical protein SAMN05216327_105347 [Dyadobacter sp. SG02]|nr:hypothetical protein SAMN05216327_105347 [Dyadobacter sp. SG02]